MKNSLKVFIIILITACSLIFRPGLSIATVLDTPSDSSLITVVGLSETGPIEAGKVYTIQWKQQSAENINSIDYFLEVDSADLKDSHSGGTFPDFDKKKIVVNGDVASYDLLIPEYMDPKFTYEISLHVYKPSNYTDNNQQPYVNRRSRYLKLVNNTEYGKTRFHTMTSNINELKTVLVNLDSSKSYVVDNSYNLSWSSECKGGLVNVWFATVPDGEGNQLLFPLTGFKNSFQLMGQNSSYDFPNAFSFNAILNNNKEELAWKVPLTLGFTSFSFNTQQSESYMIFRKSDGIYRVNEMVTNPTILRTSEVDHVIRVDIKGDNCYATGVSAPFKTLKTSPSSISKSTQFTQPASTSNTLNQNNQIVKAESNNKSVVSNNKNIVDTDLTKRLSGLIVLQIESKGEAWYINPKDGKKYYMSDGAAAFNVMRNLGVGISNSDLNKIKSDVNYRKKFIGKIFLQVESKGEAYYISSNGRYNYLKDGQSAYEVMRSLGLGITNSNLNKISTGK